MKIAVDADGTILDWGANWDKYAREYQHLGLPLTERQNSFDLTAGLTTEGKAAVLSIMDRPGFYAELEPFPGAVKALNQLVEFGHDVVICTSPWLTNVTCAQDKLDSIERHFGKGWGARTIITSDKTWITADILIDDKPEIHGALEPTWEQVYFTQPYNINIEGKRRIDSWETSEWASLLLDS